MNLFLFPEPGPGTRSRSKLPRAMETSRCDGETKTQESTLNVVTHVEELLSSEHRRARTPEILARARNFQLQS